MLCNKCGTDKDYEAFKKRGAAKRSSPCKLCDRKARGLRVSLDPVRAKDQARRALLKIRLRPDYKAKEQRASLERYHKLKHTDEYRAYDKVNKLTKKLRKYGLTIEDYTRMYDAQLGKCLICYEPHATLCVDHNHATGSVRGLLCRKCNVGLGFFRDNPARLETAASYLRTR